MSILNDDEIRSHIIEEKISLKPFQEANINPASYDLSLEGVKSLSNPEHVMPQEYEDEGIIEVLPHESVLMGTVEYIELPNNICGLIMSKSSVFRKGLVIGSAGWIDPGFKGNLTILMYNSTQKTIRLRYMQKMWNLVFTKINPVENIYEGKYQGSKGIVEEKKDEST